MRTSSIFDIVKPLLIEKGGLNSNPDLSDTQGFMTTEEKLGECQRCLGNKASYRYILVCKVIN